MKVLFVNNAILPNNKAHSVNIFRVADAISRIEPGSLAIARNYKNKKVALSEAELKNNGTNNINNFVLFPKNIFMFWFFVMSFLLFKSRKKYIVYSRTPAICIIGRILGYKVGLHVHGLFSKRWKEKFTPAVLKVLNINLFTVSEGLKNHLREAHGLINVKVARNGVCLKDFEVAQPPQQLKTIFGFDPQKLLCVYSGNLYPGRGLDIILHLAKRFPSVNFAIAGGDISSVNLLKEKAENIKNIHVIGRLGFKQVVKLLLSGDILLMPYERKVGISNGGVHQDTFIGPLKLYEYLAAGKPIIASDSKGLTEVLIHEENSLLADPENLAQWEQSLSRLISNDLLRFKLALEANAKGKEFDVDAITRFVILDITK